MHQYYEDIISKLGNPIWWDEHAVPRYCEFSPEEVADIYAREVVYFLIECQNCGRMFRVAISNSGYDKKYEKYSLIPHILEKSIGYGDPPNIRCCGAGPTMTSDNLCVLEFWHRYFDKEHYD
jgi:hypothetical protein